MLFRWTTSLVSLLAAASATPAQFSNGAEEISARADSHCKDFNLPVKAKAQNKLIYSPTHDLNTVAGVASFLSSTAGVFGQEFANFPVSGTYPMSVRYCPATGMEKGAPASRGKTLQILWHGIPYDKNYWQGHKYPNPKIQNYYNWVKTMNERGYPTLSIDNLGNGNSTIHPNPILVVQQPLETSILHGIVELARAGKIGHGVPKAEKIVYVGHSYASVLGNAVMDRYPKDFDAAILTGYTYTIANAVPGVLLANLAPVELYNPTKYLGYPPGYITFDARFGKRQSYYAAKGDFLPEMANFDFANEGITTVGEIATFFSGLQKAEKYTGDVLTITGENDALFCGLGSRTVQIPHCGKGKDSIPAKSGQFFPKANYNYYMPPGTSHATNLHKSAPLIFKHAHEWLGKNGY